MRLSAAAAAVATAATDAAVAAAAGQLRDSLNDDKGARRRRTKWVRNINHFAQTSPGLAVSPISLSF